MIRNSTKTTIAVGTLMMAGCAVSPVAQNQPAPAVKAYQLQGVAPTPTPCPTHTPKPTPTPTPTPCPCDVTGGGFIFLEGERVNFGFNALTIAGNSRIRGNVNIIDRANDVHYQSAAVTSIDCDVEGEHPRLTGTVTIEGTLRTGEPFVFVVEDIGEPGIIDTVSFTVDGTLIFEETDLGDGGPGGGNIQIHSDECD